MRDEVHILWLSAGLGCDGDSISLTAATQPQTCCGRTARRCAPCG
ncbi:MAG TPA: hypothetical protein VMU20_02490 [Candidatus Dormibacteraeota bacterium]|nr:hypothetical protein [Candidatus Dormibacteraeota bacterium]